MQVIYIANECWVYFAGRVSRSVFPRSYYTFSHSYQYMRRYLFIFFFSSFFLSSYIFDTSLSPHHHHNHHTLLLTPLYSFLSMLHNAHHHSPSILFLFPFQQPMATPFKSIFISNLLVRFSSLLSLCFSGTQTGWLLIHIISFPAQRCSERDSIISEH